MTLDRKVEEDALVKRISPRPGTMLFLAFAFLSIWPVPARADVSPSTAITFEQVILDESFLAYQRDVGDVDGDGKNDIVGVSGDIGNPTETLSWFQYPLFTRETLVDFGSLGTGLACDDMKLGDIDGDGDPDVVTRVGTGDIGTVVWFENPRPASPLSSTWLRHDIGDNGYTKDLMVQDFDGDNKPDIVSREDSKTQIWFQDTPVSWTKVEFSHHSHEGMAVGDLDNDGDPDVVLNGFWHETPSDPRTGDYVEHNIDSKWWDQSGGGWQDNSSKVVVADVDGDSTPDVVLSHSEKPGYPVSWYSATDPKNGPWTEHVISPQCDYCHNLQAADFDNDGYMDVLAGGMTISQHKGLTLYLGDGAGSWIPLVVQELGSYSAELGDIGNDGDVDIITVRNHETLPTEMWVNKLGAGGLDDWTYIQVSSNHQRVFGLTFADIDGDGQTDIVSGPYWYRNPGGNMGSSWTQESLPQAGGRDVDALLALNVDDDGLADIIAMNSDGGVYWLEMAMYPLATADTEVNVLNVIEVGSFPAAVDNISSQGYKLAQIVPGGKPEVVLVVPDPDTGNDSIWYFEVPADPENGNWPKTRIVGGTDSNRTQGVGVGDVDGDGWDDVTGGFLDLDGTTRIAWWKNPSDGSPDWQRYPVGETYGPYPDRHEVAELSGDGRLDIVIGDEGEGGRLYWFEQPADPMSPDWPRHSIYDQQTHSLDVADMDGDGDTDVISGEQFGTQKVMVWENDGSGSFTEHVVDSGKESHLGARVADLDGDGDLEIVSIAWDAFQFVHLWRNGGSNQPQMHLPIALKHTAPANLDFYSEDFESYAAGSDPADWLDTDADNSMVENDTLFAVSELNGGQVFSTSSTETNIHSHYVGAGSHGYTNYRYAGRMRMTAADGGIGVTFFSDYPNSDHYYRLRRYGDNSFHLSPHGTDVSGSTDTGVVPVPNVWYWFQVEVEDTGTQTNIRAKVWPDDGTPEPVDWQIDAFDASATRVTAGTFGVWSFASGSKYWDDLVVNSLLDAACDGHCRYYDGSAMINRILLFLHSLQEYLPVAISNWVSG